VDSICKMMLSLRRIYDGDDDNKYLNIVFKFKSIRGPSYLIIWSISLIKFISNIVSYIYYMSSIISQHS
jgi:hypothetical protein